MTKFTEIFDTLICIKCKKVIEKNGPKVFYVICKKCKKEIMKMMKENFL